MVPTLTLPRQIRRVACALALLLPSFQAAASAQSPDKSPAEVSGFELTFPAMGTILSFQAFSDDETRVERVFGEARREVQRLVEILSDYGAETETVLLSRPEKVGQWQTVSPELWEVLEVCDRWHDLTDGAFDASVGQLSVLWRKARKSKTLPSRQAIDQALEHCGWQHVHLDRAGHRVKLDIEGLKLDFGALGKGYIIDKAYQRLAAGGLPMALVRAGGDLRCGAAPPGKAGWPIEIARLAGDDDEENPPRLSLANAAISSSGDLYQFLEIDGQRRSHVLDPRTGMGVLGPRLVTVIAANSTEADAADTALCVMQDAAALKVARQVGNIEVRIASVSQADGQSLIVHTTPGFDPK